MNNFILNLFSSKAFKNKIMIKVRQIEKPTKSEIRAKDRTIKERKRKMTSVGSH